MSVFVEQTAKPCAFTSSESWVILSPIEQRIKHKIEAVGTPLKNWNIQINYGIKTGCNEAFIINEAKRAEILTNCRDAAERNRTEQIIRPLPSSRPWSGRHDESFLPLSRLQWFYRHRLLKVGSFGKVQQSSHDR